MNVATYIRVSSDEQTTANQIPDLERLCAARDWTITRRYEETVSGSAKVRPQLARMLMDAHRGEFKVLVAWSADRISRDGATGLLKLLERLDAAGVQFISAREPYIDSAGPFRDVVVSLLGTFAKMEKARLIERTRAGLQRAKAEGIRLGRPPVSEVRLAEARQHVAQGRPVAVAARLARVGEGTLRRHLHARGLLQAGAKKGSAAAAP